MPKAASKPTLIPIIYGLAQFELADVDRLVAWFESIANAKKKELDNLPTGGDQDDWSIDYFEKIYSVTHLNAELSIIALWRCVELSKRRVILNTLGEEEARDSGYYTKAKKALRKIGITPKGLECSVEVDELRCLNNSIKHDGYVSEPLAKFDCWRGQEGNEILNISDNYPRLRDAAEIYIKDLVDKADEWLGQSDG
jgi:hypothetical protein